MDNLELSNYQGIKSKIKTELNRVAESFVEIGYQLKQVRDGELYKLDGYSNINEFAKAEYSLSQSTTSRFIAINNKFSLNGGSQKLLEKYEGYGYSKLSEMLTLTDDDLQLITVQTTVAEIRKIKSTMNYGINDIIKEVDRRESKLEALCDDKFIEDLRKRAKIKLDAIRLLREYLEEDTIPMYCPHCHELLNLGGQDEHRD